MASSPRARATSSNAYNWTGNGEYAKCGAPTRNASALFNNEYAQPNMQGQYSNEIMATAEREIMDDMTLRLDYQHRWLGTIIEDGAGPRLQQRARQPGPRARVGHHRRQQRSSCRRRRRPAMPNDPGAARRQPAECRSTNLSASSNWPPPPRRSATYDAITLSLNKQFSKAWFARAAYTYSRLIGNYEGLYQNETNYIAPNGNNAYD